MVSIFDQFTRPNVRGSIGQQVSKSENKLVRHFTFSFIMLIALWLISRVPKL